MKFPQLRPDLSHSVAVFYEDPADPNHRRYYVVATGWDGKVTVNEYDDRRGTSRIFHVTLAEWNDNMISDSVLLDQETVDLLYTYSPEYADQIASRTNTPS